LNCSYFSWYLELNGFNGCFEDKMAGRMARRAGKLDWEWVIMN
jgi:hypothetical protein